MAAFVGGSGHRIVEIDRGSKVARVVLDGADWPLYTRVSEADLITNAVAICLGAAPTMLCQNYACRSHPDPGRSQSRRSLGPLTPLSALCIPPKPAGGISTNIAQSGILTETP